MVVGFLLKFIYLSLLLSLFLSLKNSLSFSLPIRLSFKASFFIKVFLILQLSLKFSLLPLLDLKSSDISESLDLKRESKRIDVEEVMSSFLQKVRELGKGKGT